MAAGSEHRRLRSARSPGALLGRARALALALVAAATAATAACTPSSTSTEGPATDAGSPDAAADPIAALRPFEDATRRSLDLARPPSAEIGMGADPWALRRVPSGWVGILRGRSAVVLLDDDLNELARCPAPRSPTGLAIANSGEVLVIGELASTIGRFAIRGRSLVPLGELPVPGAMGLRDLAVSPGGATWVLDERGGALLHVLLEPTRVTVKARLPVGHGAASVMATARHVVVNAVTDHRLVVIATDASGAPAVTAPVQIAHDGPFWGFDARETPQGLLVAAGGVEDHPLDRTGGYFGFIDSFVFAYRVGEHAAERVAAVNVSEHGVITPKALAIEGADGDDVTLLVTGYGAASGIRLGLRAGTPSTIAPLPLLPGIRALERAGRTTAMADPLLDAWAALDERGLRVVAVANEPPRPVASRLGEALFFTSLMAPKNTSSGAHSRFTCETCHFEGYVDGRTHHTGREDVHATTKPLVGLVGNRPYFSRALDPDLSTVSHAEFRVAGAGSGTDPFFALEPREHGAWLARVGVSSRVEPLELRRALLRFLTDLSHRPNPAVIGRVAFDATEREGARIFRDRCETCHAARLSADDASTRVAFEQWEALVMNEAAPLVWGSAGYKKTGVTPYVHDDGARTPSLRRLYKKYPYFTNGTAKSLDDVLEGVRVAGPSLFHASAPTTAQPLDDASKRALRAFLDLL